MPDRSRGQVNYDAYWDAVGGISPVTGDALPGYDVLKPEVKAGWEAGAMAVELRFAEQLRSVALTLWNAAAPVVGAAARALGDVAKGRPS